jgi:hypothetical protein
MRHRAEIVFLNEIVIAKGDNSALIALIEGGQRIFDGGVDVARERLADARRRLRTAAAILKANNIPMK